MPLTMWPGFASTERHAEFVLRAIESAGDVRRRHQFFVWLGSYVHPLVPHDLVICGAYQRSRRELAFDLFNSVAVPAALSAAVQAGQSLMHTLTSSWVEHGGGAIAIDAGTMPSGSLFEAAGFTTLLVDCTSRPQRRSEVECLFAFATTADRPPAMRANLELLLPYLRSTYLLVQATEVNQLGAVGQRATRRARSHSPITERERQILDWVREGKSNAQIGELLDISGLTVKNHVHKILHKLGATNRAQAVACALGRNLLGPSEHDGVR